MKYIVLLAILFFSCKEKTWDSGTWFDELGSVKSNDGFVSTVWSTFQFEILDSDIMEKKSANEKPQNYVASLVKQSIIKIISDNKCGIWNGATKKMTYAKIQNSLDNYIKTDGVKITLVDVLSHNYEECIKQ